MENKENKANKKSKIWLLVTIAIFVIAFLCFIPFWINSSYLQGGGMQTVWSGSELLAFYGATLSAVGALFLGGLSIWQNNQLKKANEEAQRRLERISYRSNELSIINKMIEYENRRIQEMGSYSEEFSKSCAGVEMANAIFENKNLKSTSADLLTKAGYNFTNLAREIRTDRLLTENSSVIVSLMDLYTRNYNICNSIVITGKTDQIERKEMDELRESFFTYRTEFEKYTAYCQSRLRKMIFEELSLEEIRQLFGYKQED